MESIFTLSHMEAHLKVILATRCLAAEARMWWMTIGEPAMPGGSWADFRALISARYGLMPNEDANVPARDPAIYDDMYHWRFLSYVADWSAYPNESMGHYCRRFREAMIPYFPHDLGDPLLQALHLIREGLPPNVKPFVPEGVVGMTLEVMIQAIMDAEVIVHGMQAAVPDEEDQVVPVFEAAVEEEVEAADDILDPADFPFDLEDHPEDPPIIDDEGDVELWEEQEGVIEEDIDGLEEPEDDPEEILLDHADWDANSDISDITIV